MLVKGGPGSHALLSMSFTVTSSPKTRNKEGNNWNWMWKFFLEPKSPKISFGQNIHYNRRILVQFCTKHAGGTTMNWMKIYNENRQGNKMYRHKVLQGFSRTWFSDWLSLLARTSGAPFTNRVYLDCFEIRKWIIITSTKRNHVIIHLCHKFNDTLKFRCIND